MKISRYITSPQINRMLLLFYFLASVLFFAPVFISLSLLKALSWFVILVVFIFSVPEIINGISKRSSHHYIMLIWVVIFYLSVINSLLQHQQNPILTLRLVFDLLPLLLFYFLVRRDYKIEDVEKTIVLMSAIYMIVFCVALFFAPKVIFDNTGGEIGISHERGVARVKLLGSNFVYYCFFLFVGKYNEQRQKKYIIYFVVMLIFIILNVSRQHILITFLLGTFLFLRNYPWYVKPIIASVLITLTIVLVLNSEIFLSMIQLTLQQISDTGIDNIRILAAKYFITEYPSNIASILLGQGIPYSTSEWGKSYWYIMRFYGYILSDVGYVKIYFYWGILGLVGVYLLFSKILVYKFQGRYQYIKYYTLFILLANIASHNFFVDIMFVSIVFYIHYKLMMEKVKIK
nr:hypothetical protein [uncultured Carboxylicivirga sp.]